MTCALFASPLFFQQYAQAQHPVFVILIGRYQALWEK